MIAELTDVMARAKFQTLFERSPATPEQLLADIRILAEIFDPPRLPEPVSRDLDDDAVLAVALASRPDFIISGDLDLLTLGSFAGIPIVTPADALARIDNI